VSDAAVAAPAESPAPSIVTKRVLKFRFPHEAWVQVRDSTGRTIVARLHAAGTERVVDGIPPFRVIIGKANGIQLFDNDQPVDLTRYISDDVARLTLK
jgi:cytoskeleton protein RodZ